MAALVPATLTRRLTASFQAVHLEAVEPIRDVLAHTLPEGYAMACEAQRDFDVRSKLGSIRCPTLTVAGRHDSGTLPAATQAIADAIEGAQFELLDAAHLRPSSNLIVLLHCLKRFLKGRSNR